MRVTVTAFEAFDGHPVNSSEVAIRELARLDTSTLPCEVKTLVLPTVYTQVGASICALLRPPAPDVLFMTGMAHGVDTILVETLARNLDSSVAPDNVGEVRLACPVRKGGANVYHATIDTWSTFWVLHALGLPTTLSKDAGGFVCNHAFYVARYEIERRNLPTRCGLVHLPAIDEPIALPDSVGRPPTWSVTSLLLALRLCIDVLECGSGSN